MQKGPREWREEREEEARNEGKRKAGGKAVEGERGRGGRLGT